MFIKTVSTTSGINPIQFDETGGVFYWILNTGSSTIYASTKAAFTAGDDGVVSLGPKESRRLETNNDTIYILGEGQVEIHNQRDGICSFKQAPTSSGSGGGEAVDAYTKTESDARYAMKTDVPDAYTKNESDTKYAQKTDVPDAYTKNESDTKYAQKTDVPDAYTKTESDAKYAQKTDVAPYKMGMDFGMCTTAAATISKVATTLNKVAPSKGAVFTIKFTNSVPAKSRLSVNGLTGYLYYKGSSISANIIDAGDVVTFMYYESRELNIFEVLSIENGGNAKTVNGFTVGCNVPADAVFTPPDLSGYASKALYGDTTINIGREAGSDVGEYSTAIGHNTIASGYNAYSQGVDTKAIGVSSHAEGTSTQATANSSHAEGTSTQATANSSHAEGVGTTASGAWSHAEGDNTTASNDASHAEGDKTVASGISSHAEGSSTIAIGAWSHAEGQFTIANNDAEHASGKFNVSNEDTLFSVGDGTNSDNRHNAFEITKTGGKLHDRDIAVKDDIIYPNLLINPDFKINQRGGTSWGVSYSQGAPIPASRKYTVDRWRIMEGNAVITEGKFVLNGTIIQVLENSIGTDFAASVSVENGSATASYDDTTKTFTITGENATLNWAKLERGNVATTFIQPDPATELMKCRRYYRTMCRGALAVAVDATSVAFVDSFDVPMRIDPTAKILSPVVLNYSNGWLDQPDVTKMSIVSANLTKMGACYIHINGFNVTVDGTAFTANFLFKAATDNFIEFDAEIY